VAQKLRLLLLIPHLGSGGAEQATALLARGLSREKYEVHLGLVTHFPSPESMPPWVAVHRLESSRLRFGALPLLRLVRRLKPDLILSGSAHLNFLVLLLHPFYPRKTRVLVRQNTAVSSVLAFGGVPWYTRFLYRHLYPRADRIICPSRAMADDIAREVHVRKDRIAVLPNPIDIATIRAAAKQGMRRSTGRWSGLGPHLLAAGDLTPERSFDLLLQALALIRRRFPHADLVIAGSGPEEHSLRELCHALGLAPAVHFAGDIEHPRQFYRQASLFVLPSRLEQMPEAVLDALAGELPLVAVPVAAGVADLLCGRPGIWIAAETSAGALASALIRAFEELSPGQRFHRSLQPAS